MSTLLPPPAGGPVIPAGLYPHGSQLSADLNQLITNPILFTATGILARLRQASSAQTLSTSSATVIQFDTVDEDPYSGWSASATSTQAAWSWQPPAGCSGWYHVYVAVSLGTVPSDAVLRPVIVVTGTTQYAVETMLRPSSAPEIVGGSAWVYMLGGADYVQAAAVFSSSSGSEPTSVATSYQSVMDVSWESN